MLLTGIDAFDRLARDSPADLEKFLATVHEAGWIIKATDKLPVTIVAQFFPRQRRFSFHPARMSILTRNPLRKDVIVDRSGPINDQGQLPEFLDQAVKAWRKAQVLYDGISWQGEPRATAIAEEIAKSHPEWTDHLFSLLLDPSQLVAGYALWTLELMKSPLLENIPPEVLQSRSRVTVTTRDLKDTKELGWLARQAQRRARTRAGTSPASPALQAKEVGLSAGT